MNNSNKTLDDMCRACMCKNQTFHSLSSEAADKPLTIYEMFETTIPQVPIHINDELPKKICAACLNTLVIVHKFQQMCIASDTYMRSLLVSNLLASNNSFSGIADANEEINHTVMEQKSAKLHILRETRTFNTPAHSVKIEAVSEPVLLKTEAYQYNDEMDSEWSDDDDKPLRNSENLNLSPLVKEEFQNFMTFEVSEVEVQECDLTTALTTKIEKSETSTLDCADVHNDNTMRIELSPDAERKVLFDYGEDSTTKDLESNISDDTDTNSDWNDGDNRYQKKSTSNVSRSEKQQPSISSVTNEIDAYEIEKPSLSSHLINFPCPHCDAVFSSDFKLQQHSHLHDETRLSVCDVCNYRFESRRSLAQHKKTHKTAPPGGFKCPKCPRRFEKKTSLSTHKRTHREQHFKCNLCPQKFRNPTRLTDHLQQHESQKLIHENEIDNKDTNLEQRNDDDNDTNLVWNDGDNSRHPKKLKSNVSIAEQQKPSSSSVTNETDVSESEKANSHFKHIIHCPHCDVVFASKFKFKQHSRLHGEARPIVHVSYEIEKPRSSSHLRFNFPCPHCDAVFASNYTLKKHSHLHDEARLFLCDVCNYRFETSTNLLQHKKTHLMTPPEGFECPKCPRRFEKQISLISHMKKHRKSLSKCNLSPQEIVKQERENDEKDTNL